MSFGLNASSELSSFQDATGESTQYGYTNGALTSITQPDGSVTRLTYTSDTPRRAATVTFGYGSTVAATTSFAYPDASTTKVTDANNHVTTYTVDARARVTRVLDALGRSRSTTYSPNDEVATLTDGATSAVTRRSYDANNNLTSIQAPDLAGGSAGSGRTVKFGYPAATGTFADFKPTSSTDAQGNQTTYGYSTAGNLSTLTTPGAAGGTLSNKYQGKTGVSCGVKPGQLCSSTDGLGHVTSYTYDTAGNLTKVTPPAPLGATVVVPDPVGRAASVTDGNGQKTSYSYDADDRIGEIRYAGTTTCTPSAGTCIRYGYDGQGALTSREDNTGTTTWSYDAQGR